MNRRFVDICETFVAPGKSDFGMQNGRVLVRRLLHQRVQGQIGGIGVHPSSPVQREAYLKTLKLMALQAFRIETRRLLFCAGNALHEMGRI